MYSIDVSVARENKVKIYLRKKLKFVGTAPRGCCLQTKTEEQAVTVKSEVEVKNCRKYTEKNSKVDESACFSEQNLCLYFLFNNFLRWFGIRMPNVSIVKISLFSSCVNADMGPKDLDWII